MRRENYDDAPSIAHPAAPLQTYPQLQIIGSRLVDGTQAGSQSTHQTLRELWLSEFQRIADAQILQVALLNMSQILQKCSNCGAGGTCRENPNSAFN